MQIFAVYGFKILCEISKGTFEISHKILNLYTANMYFTVFFACDDIFELWRHKPQWDGPQTAATAVTGVSKPLCRRLTQTFTLFSVNLSLYRYDSVLSYRWLIARLQYHQCVSTEDFAVLY